MEVERSFENDVIPVAKRDAKQHKSARGAFCLMFCQ